MISAREIAIGIYSAWRLLLFDRRAITYFDSTFDGFWKSFYAALVVLPAVIILRLLFLADKGDVIATAGAGRITAVFALDFVFQWVLFPLVMFHLADNLGRSRHYLNFIAARNWSQTIQIAIVLPAMVIFVAGGGGGLGLPVLIAAHLATWIYAWFIARTALDLSNTAAVFIVVTELAISIGISFTSEVLIGNA